MKKIKKHWKIILFILSILLGFFLFLHHAHKHGAEYAFDMKSINGNSHNNPYGIRNDVYDFIDNDLKKPENKSLNDPKIKNLLLNYVKVNLVSIKYFSDKEKSQEIWYQYFTIFDCLTLDINRANTYTRSLVVTPEGYESDFNKMVLKTKDHKLIDKILNSYMNGKTLNPNSRSALNHPELCDRYEFRVLNDEEFYTKDPRIVGK